MFEGIDKPISVKNNDFSIVLRLLHHKQDNRKRHECVIGRNKSIGGIANGTE